MSELCLIKWERLCLKQELHDKVEAYIFNQWHLIMLVWPTKWVSNEALFFFFKFKCIFNPSPLIYKIRF